MNRLISENDYKALQSAVEAHREMTLVRVFGPYKLTVAVTPATPVWGIPIIVQVREWNDGKSCVKNCASVAEMRNYLGKWHFPMPRPLCPSTR